MKRAEFIKKYYDLKKGINIEEMKKDRAEVERLENLDNSFDWMLPDFDSKKPKTKPKPKRRIFVKKIITNYIKNYRADIFGIMISLGEAIFFPDFSGC